MTDETREQRGIDRDEETDDAAREQGVRTEHPEEPLESADDVAGGGRRTGLLTRSSFRG